MSGLQGNLAPKNLGWMMYSSTMSAMCITFVPTQMRDGICATPQLLCHSIQSNVCSRKHSLLTLAAITFKCHHKRSIAAAPSCPCNMCQSSLTSVSVSPVGICTIQFSPCALVNANDHEAGGWRRGRNGGVERG